MAQEFSTCLEKHQEVLDRFSYCRSPTDIYTQIMELGKELPPINEIHKIPENKVQGCQSTLYLHTECTDGVLIFTASADALISAGLAALLIDAYNGEPPEALLKTPPSFLQTLNIPTSLSPSRSNGLASLHKRMQQDALKYLINY